MTRLPSLYCFLALLFASQFVAAATPQEAGFLQNEQLLREQQQRLKMLERERLLRQLERSLSRPPVPETPRPETGSLPVSDVCFDIDTIVFDGVQNLLQQEIAMLKQPWLGKCLSLADIDRLRASVERHYIDQGWIMARAYLKPGQNIRSGTLVLVVHEGRLADIRLNFNKLSERLQVATAFPSMLDESLYLRDIEQGLDQINRLASNRATMTMEPVKERPGHTRMLISNVVHNPTRLTAGYDNQGSQSTGDQRGTLTLESDNLMSLNDNVFINLAESVEGKGLSSNRSAMLSMSLPYGYWLYTVSVNRSQYYTTNSSDSGTFVTRGESGTDSLRVSRVIARDKTGKTSIDMTLSVKRTETFLEDVRLETGTRKLVTADLQWMHIERLSNMSWTAQLTYSRGLDAFGALLDDPLAGDDIPKAQFEKLGWNMTLNKPFEIADRALQYQGTLSGQISRDALYGTEQLALGGLGSVRGFRDSPVSGDSGVVVKNDVVWRPQFARRWLQGLSLSAGLDAGHVRVRNNNINNTGNSSATLTGLSLSARQQLALPHDQQLNWSLTLGQALSAPSYVDSSKPVVMFSLGWKFW